MLINKIYNRPLSYLMPLFRVLVQNLSYADEFDLHEMEPVKGGGMFFFLSKVSHEDSFSHRGQRQLGNRILTAKTNSLANQVASWLIEPLI